jgi:hypothetical protein
VSHSSKTEKIMRTIGEHEMQRRARPPVYCIGYEPNPGVTNLNEDDTHKIWTHRTQ